MRRSQAQSPQEAIRVQSDAWEEAMGDTENLALHILLSEHLHPIVKEPDPQWPT